MKFIGRIVLLSILIFVCETQIIAASRPLRLSLAHAEQSALMQSPELRGLHAKMVALHEQAVAANQLTDPKLTVGAINVPVNSFSFTQENMTQLQFGLIQGFPRGRSLHYKSKIKRKLANQVHQHFLEMRLRILRGVRTSWVELYYGLATRRILLTQQQVFRHLVAVSESLLANDQVKQEDVVGAQLDLARIKNRLIVVGQKIAIARANLARWVGPRLARQARPVRWPRWVLPPPLKVLMAKLMIHPRLQMVEALIHARTAGISLAKQQYRPGFALGVAYGVRQGRAPNGINRADVMSARVVMDLPIFTRNRQDRQLAAAESLLTVSQEKQLSDYRRLRDFLKGQYAFWMHHHLSARWYRQVLIPRSKQYARASLNSYQNHRADFTTVSTAMTGALDTQLEQLKILVETQVARINLLYVQGK